MKVGIFTFHQALNNGAVLQAYALEKTIEKLGADVEIVDYISPKIKEDYSLIKLKKGLKAFLISCKLLPQTMVQKKNFNRFVSSIVRVSKKQYTPKNISLINDDYDVFVTGSDQVFSPTCAGFDENYFLTFAKKGRKYSYAASLGQDRLPEHLLQEYKNRLEDFEVLSCREKSAVKALDNVYDKDVLCHIDPVFLLDRLEWEGIVQERIIKEPYIFVFRVHVPVDLFKYAEKLRRETGLKLVYADGKRIYFDDSARYIPGISPDIFLNLIANADCVVTNSFHGVAFSTIFHKKLYVELNNTGIRNTRAELLLAQLEVSYYEILNDTNVKFVDNADWKRVDENIAKEAERSLGYLRQIIEK